MAAAVGNTSLSSALNTTQRAQSEPSTYMGKCWKKIHGDAILKAVFITLLVVGILAAVVGGLVFAGKLGIALAGVGVMSQMVGLYTMIGGIGTVLLVSLAACAKKYLCTNRPNVAVPPPA